MRSMLLVERFESVLDELIAREDVHSAFVAVRNGSGSLNWSGARGTVSAGGPAVTPDTPWFTASITKLFIAATVMRLVEEGELALTDRLVDRLPAALTDRLHVLNGVDRTAQITLEHLLSHTSGLPDYIEDYPTRSKAPGSLIDILLKEGDRDWSLAETTQWVREQLKPHFPPQSLQAGRARVRYSDTNYQLLMGVVAACRGAPFARVLDELVLNPLSLQNSWLPGDVERQSMAPAVATLYAGAEPLQIPRFLAAIGDMYSTSSDLLCFLQATIQDQLFREQDTWPRMQQPCRSFGLPRDRASLRQPAWPIAYGLGVMRFRLPRLLTPFRRIPEVVGHSGSTGTWLFHAPELDLYLTGSVNQVTAGAVPYRVLPRLLQSVSQR